MTDLLDFVALSLLPRVVLAGRRRLAAPRRSARRRRPPARSTPARRTTPDRSAGVRVAGRGRASAAPRRRRSRRFRGATPAYPAALTTIADPPPVLWTRGRAAALERAGGRHRRIARRVAVRRSRSPNGSPADLAARGLVIVSGLARGVDSAAHRGALAAGGVDGRGARVRRRRHLSARARGARARRSTRRGAVVSELVPGHAAAAVVLSAAQPHHQRPVARGRRHRGGREERVAHHGALRARAGARRAGRAGQRPERPEPRRPRAPAGRCKDRGVGGRYPGGAGHGARRVGAARRRRRRSAAATRCSTAWCRARPAISTRLPSDPA